MITLKSAHERQLMYDAGQIVYEALMAVKVAVAPGITTKELDTIAETIIRKHGAVPSFLGYNGFTGSICASVDDVVVHGIPSPKIVLEEGQIIGIDCGAILHGFQGDAALTVGVGKISQEAETLIRETEVAFWKGAAQAVNGNRIGDIGHAVQQHCKGFGFDVVRALCGHGIGQEMHEEPEIPNYGPPGRGIRIRPGMALAIEPMVVTGNYPVHIESDGWTVCTDDGGLCSHYEHTVFVREDGRPEILTLPAAPEGWL